ncbi:MAG: DEAD/DEAH box helicase [Verrucomicrobiota bacterium JB022]|nr:DEAD/DEAH box helicase [Verrucomicrobiota bacterium JB022]
MNKNPSVTLRPYQVEFVQKTAEALLEYQRVLSVAATGAGKTVMAAKLAETLASCGPVLFLADAQELVMQTGQKFCKVLGQFPAVEMAEHHARPGDRLVVGTTQSVARRLDKWPRDYFATIIVDEAHRNTLGAQAQQVLGHFRRAQVIGITATPFRSDKQQLSSFYEAIPVEIGLVRLIKEGFLSPITIKTVPVDVDLSGVRSLAGDYKDSDLGAAITPHLERCAQILHRHAADRRTVAFLPLIETSKAFAEACRQVGLHAVHVDGTDRSALRGDWQVICNSQLLTTGWDEPSVDCVFVLRPTKSLSLYSQMVGRGTRIHPGKVNCLLLDPLYQAERMDLIRPARLVAANQEEAESIQQILDTDEGELLEIRERAEADRRKGMLEAMQANAKRKSRTIDAVELALSLGETALAEYEPEAMWEGYPVTDKQAEILERNGLDLESIKCKGHASKLIDLLIKRREMGLATPKQVKWLIQFKHPEPWSATFGDATEFLDQRFGKRRTA